jgi:hypothetical protein
MHPSTHAPRSLLCLLSSILALLPACSSDSAAADPPASQGGASGQGASGGQPGAGQAGGGAAQGAGAGGKGGQAGAAPGGQNQGGAGQPQGGAGQNQGGAGSAQAGAAQGGAGSAQGGAGAAQGGAGSAQGGAGSGSITAEALLALVASCSPVSKGKYLTDADSPQPPSIDICGLKGAVFWKADMDVDCDGQTTAQCSLATDPAYQDQTSATDSQDQPLVASELPYVVIPLPSARFDYTQQGLALGSVVAVIYQGQVAFGVFGDEGPEDIIGEASYAMAKSLGINPDPSIGGTDSGVTYIAFTGAGTVASPIEDHSAAVALGQTLAAKLLADNP